jgi:hypothetical protein
MRAAENGIRIVDPPSNPPNSHRSDGFQDQLEQASDLVTLAILQMISFMGSAVWTEVPVQPRNVTHTLATKPQLIRSTSEGSLDY